MSASMPPTGRRMASFSSTKVVGEPLYTRDFKYPHNKKSLGVKSGDRVGHLNLQRRLITRSIFSESFQQERPDFTCKVGRGSMPHEGDDR
ncbi:hypothetical protein AVEN_260249-1 [Araneus ventricosus]|uniref:Uncharacterized protein n=1 Tax=Araneus ventricosus TaxID=182803 RepID=A0A4Y2EDZ9_ARAVE|nr:hypothetical protein AVEN_259101-1 [Araneus ventricosus]GBM26500.1 hypothetical protein AVEN_260249-1 [Araneus ventricosus]